ncbi:hypothetical protein EG327_003285 [Venturia inaequalis]|nr:hypothetical protein EG327_003285 [Venturia inaequalis]
MDPQPPQCGFEGNPDLYGLGIRIGVYFQWASALIIWRWYPEGRNELGGAYLVFLFALLIAMVVITARREPIHSAEILLLIYIIFGGVFTVMMIGLRKSHLQKAKKIKTSWPQTMALFFILAAASIYCTWFWLSGIHHHDFLDTNCGTYGFLFTKVSLKNKHVTRFFAALSMYLAILYTLGSVYAVGALAAFLMKAPWLIRIIQESKRLSRARDAKSPERSPLLRSWRIAELATGIIAPATNIVSFFYSIIGLEMTLHWNHVTGVYTINSVGQLIPFVIGLVGFIKVIYEPIKEKYKLGKRQTDGIEGDSRGDVEHDHESEKNAISGLKELNQSRDVEFEAASANRRLGYLDLIKPVERVTVGEWRKDGFKS